MEKERGGMITVDSMEQNDALVAWLEDERSRYRTCVAQGSDETLVATAYDSDGKSFKRQTFIRVDGTTAEAENI